MSSLTAIILIVIFSTVISLSAISTINYRKWITDCTRRLDGGSSLIETPYGQVEYSVYGDIGPPILFVHAQPGGYDQGSLLAESAVQHGYKVVSISRPGYLRTPLELGRTPTQQADAFCAVLDGLEISHLPVIGISGGGPTAIEFAIRHSDRCSALGLVSAVSLAMEPSTKLLGRLLSSRAFTSDLAGWLLGSVVERWPVFLVRALVAEARSRDNVLSDPVKLSMLMGLAGAGIELPARRRQGSRNDVQQFSALPLLEVKLIPVPTLVIHGTDDDLVPFAHGLYVAENAPLVELQAIEGGSHAILATHAQEVLSRLFSFIGAHGENNAD